MSVAHPFQPARTRSPKFPRRPGPATDTRPAGASTAPRAAAAPVVPGTRTPAGLPRELVVDESGRPRRSVLLAAIMIRRGRSVTEIAQATGLAPDVVTCLARSL